ncbi:MAG: hypothetical protein ACXACO_21340 [Promethearchaeota archaeon]|jgi:hypothetical protein
MKFQTISIWSNSGYKNKDFFVINSKKDFLSLWEITFSTTFPTPDPPQIDFGIKTVIAIYGGLYNKGARLEIIKILWKFNKITVYFKVQTGLTLAITHPYHIVQIAKFTKDVSFMELKKS